MIIFVSLPYNTYPKVSSCLWGGNGSKFTFMRVGFKVQAKPISRNNYYSRDPVTRRVFALLPRAHAPVNRKRLQQISETHTGQLSKQLFCL